MDNPKKVLIINDDEDIIELIALIVSEEGHQVLRKTIHGFRSGKKDFNKYLGDNNPDIVIWDIAFPYHANTTYFLAAINNDPSKTRKYIITTDTDLVVNKVTEECLRKLSFVIKPFDIEVIKEALADVSETIEAEEGKINREREN